MGLGKMGLGKIGLGKMGIGKMGLGKFRDSRKTKYSIPVRVPR